MKFQLCFSQRDLFLPHDRLANNRRVSFAVLFAYKARRLPLNSKKAKFKGCCFGFDDKIWHNHPLFTGKMLQHNEKKGGLICKGHRICRAFSEFPTSVEIQSVIIEKGAYFRRHEHWKGFLDESRINQKPCGFEGHSFNLVDTMELKIGSRHLRERCHGKYEKS